MKQEQERLRDADDLQPGFEQDQSYSHTFDSYNHRMHGFSALESINEKLNEELASQEEDEIDEDDAFDQAQKDVENVSDGQAHKESSENEQSQNSKNVDKTQHEGGENADSLDLQKKVSDEKMQKEVSDKILRSFYNSKYPDASHQIP